MYTLSKLDPYSDVFSPIRPCSLSSRVPPPPRTQPSSRLLSPTFVSKHSFGLCSSTLVNLPVNPQDGDGWHVPMVEWTPSAQRFWVRGGTKRRWKAHVKTAPLRLWAFLSPPNLIWMWHVHSVMERYCFLIPGNWGWGNCHIYYSES